MLVIDYTIVGSGHVLSHSYDGCPAQRGSGWNRLRDVVDKTQMNPIQISNSKWVDTWTFGFNWYTSHIYQAEKASHPVQKSSYMGGHFKLNSIIAIECLFEYITVDMSERKKSDKPQFMTKRQIHIPRNVVIVGTIFVCNCRGRGERQWQFSLPLPMGNTFLFNKIIIELVFQSFVQQHWILRGGMNNINFHFHFVSVHQRWKRN